MNPKSINLMIFLKKYTGIILNNSLIFFFIDLINTDWNVNKF